MSDALVASQQNQSVEFQHRMSTKASVTASKYLSGSTLHKLQDEDSMEEMLDRIAQPGDACAAWVKGRFRSATLSPITTYLAARDRMDTLDCPTKPPPSAAAQGEK